MKQVQNPRHRTNGALTTATTTWRWWSSTDNPPPALSSATYAGRRGFVKEMDDYVTPNFSKLVAEGGVINSPMSTYEITANGGDSGWKFQNSVSGPPTIWYGECFGDWCISAYGRPADPGQDPALVEHLTSLATTTAWADVDDSAVNGLAALGEMHQTLNMLGDPVRSFQDFLWKKAWADADWQKARGRAAKAAALAKLISSLWLQNQYALRPFLMDIEKILSELQNQTFTPRRTARGQQVREVSSTSTSVGGRGGINIDFTTKVESKYKVRVTIMYDAKVTPTKRFGLTWSDLPAAAWELTPWSYVADWLINVGDYIRAITPKLDVRYLSCSTTIERLTTVRRTSGQAWMSQAGWTTIRSPGAVDTATYRSKVRHPSVDRPSLTIEWDPFQSLRSNRGVNAYMLFLQQFIRR